MAPRRIAVPGVLELPNYGVVESALFLHVPVETLRYWLIEESGPLVELASLRPPLLSFKNLVECYVVDILRRVHGLTMPRLKFGIETIRELQEKRLLPQSAHPLADHELRTADGNLILLDQNGKIINVSLGGQIEIPEVVGTYLRRIVRNQHGVAQRLFPLLKRISTLDEAAQDPQLIIVDPKIAFGKPVIAGTGITTEVIAGRLTAGDTEEDLAAEYGRTAEEIRAAATFEGVPVAA